jgi:uncharacterized protein YcaQ
MLPFWRRAMLDYEVRHTGWQRWLRKNRRVMEEVRSSIEARGPLAGGDFEGRRPAGRGGWWSWKPVHHALHHLWMTGVVTVHSRRHFHKRFDLLERALPAVRDAQPPSSEEFARWHVERSLHAMGAAVEKDLTGYMTFPRFRTGQRRAALKSLLERGDVAEIAVEGRPGRWLALRRDLPALARAALGTFAPRGTTLLSPFDSLLWHRDRVKRLFGFDYRIEVYTPGDKRVHGYYTLPVLHRGELIGRIDAKTHRDERRLEVRHAHFERWFAAEGTPPTGEAHLDVGETLVGLSEALHSLATFVGADRIDLRRVTPSRLKAPLSRAISARPAPAQS